MPAPAKDSGRPGPGATRFGAVDPDDFYIEEERAAQGAEDREQRRVRLLAHARLVTILAAIWSLYEATQSVDAKGRWLIAAAALTGTAFVILIVILLFRPSGLFGKYQAEKV